MYKKNVYKKTYGSLNFRRNGKAIRIDASEGEVTFEAYPYEIPKAFMDTIVLIKDNNIEEEVVEEKVEEPVKTDDPAEKEFPQEDDSKEEKVEDTPAYKIVNKGRGYFDIVATYTDGTTKKMNHKALREDAANKMLQDLIS